jgi:hypothetical protein
MGTATKMTPFAVIATLPLVLILSIAGNVLKSGIIEKKQKFLIWILKPLACQKTHLIQLSLSRAFHRQAQ